MDCAVWRLVALMLALVPGGTATAGEICRGFGPQAPRDIAATEGLNRQAFNIAPPAVEMNLCNIHTHTQAEHKGPGFSVFAGEGEHGGYRCNETEQLSAAELEDPAKGHGAFHGVKPGDTLEVHWVFSTCTVEPGPGLGACLSDACSNPQLRVESQVFLLVNDPSAHDFANFDFAHTIINGHPQPRILPWDTGAPVVFAGSTTGPKYSAETCSPLQVTWSVRPRCARLDISSLHRWAERGNAFEEEHSHGVRALVTEPVLLSPIR
ncbi:delta-class carbonic anhydrase [Oceaniglobus roseus]|uniref:delta-class carbonic anhydrase n=1 Tax=Oceaniglobus roseus TaxID=1737570 RepID=UPI0013001264|nr:delta-class carbonic anhydrase [Kandeliimicrobium roseum]